MTTPTEAPTPPTFADLGLPKPILDALAEVGYEAPSPIQAQTIPHLLADRDVLGMAQTGTGKTAAFALPILARIDLKLAAPQALVLAPTRELAIQVAEAFQRYASHLPRFHVLPIYGGQSYQPQLSALRRGAHVIVGTPGRVMDHMDRGTLSLHALRWVVLDEADEMLRMGFIDDVDKILKGTPPTRQVALFSATMPPQIRKIAQTHLKKPAEITVREKTATVANTRQRYWLAQGVTKLEALTRILEAEPFEGMLVFVRTKQDTIELSTRLEARGFACAPLNGDIDQRTRERTVARLKGGSLDIIVATDVAARGLDVERVSHVVNFDVPTDSESYVHRIGRTGRAGRKGEAILFILPRERHLLRIIEKATRQTIAPMELPSADAVQAQRMAKLKDKLLETLADPKLVETLASIRNVLADLEREKEVTILELAAGLAYLNDPSAGSSAGPSPAAKPALSAVEGPRSLPTGAGRGKISDEPRSPFIAKRRHEGDAEEHRGAPRVRPAKRSEGLETYRLEVGSSHGVKPGNIVGALANEAELDAHNIGRVQIFDDHSLVDLPEGMPKEIFKHLQKVWVCGQQLKISRLRK
ncbi:MAG TPA: DEAD/DEAH box helicase [Verrucomicrobiae bacterium]|nr:DEAD/DEAH box helicase [Verrucomicrobiae bacterium]